MPLTHYPSGVASFGVPIVGSSYLIPPSTGTYFFVSSTKGSTNNDGLSPDTPMLTTAQAITTSTASNGDVIVMMPYHVETISTVVGWTPKAGTAIVGMGWGAARPKITFGTLAGATINVSAANCMFQNFVCTSGITELVSMFTVSGVECVINAVDVMETTAVSCISFLTTTAAANRFVVSNCRHNTTTIPTAIAAWMSIVGGDGWTIENNEIIVNRANNAVSAIIGTLTPAATNVMIRNNIMSLGTTGASKIAVSLFAGSTGIAADNRAFSLGSTLAGNFGLANAAGFNNTVSTLVNKSGLLDPVVSS